MSLSEEEESIFDTLVKNISEPNVEKIENEKPRNIVIYSVLFITGVAIMVMSVSSKIMLVGLAGFALMLYSFNMLFSLSRFGRPHQTDE